MKNAKLLLPLLVLAGWAVCPARAAEGSYGAIAASLSAAAKARHKPRVAVIGFSSETGRPSRACAVVAARITTEIASRPGLKVIDRARLNELMRGRRLNSNGVLDSALAKKIRKAFGTDAVVTGVVIELEDGKVEVNARLVDTLSGRILKAVTASVRKDWKEERQDVWNDFDIGLDMDMEFPDEPPQAGNGGSAPCRRLSDKAVAFVKACVELRARKTAFDMKTGELSPGKLTKNPGAEIKDQELKQLYYAKMKEWYDSDRLGQLTPREEAMLNKGSSMLEKYPCQ